jgi:hypothetical protein
VVAVKLCESNRDRSFGEAERDSFITQSDNTENRACGKTYEVSRVNLDFEETALAGGHSVAFDQWVIQPDRFPVLVAVAFQVSFAVNQTDARDASLNVVIIRLIVVGAGGNRNREKSE